MAEASAGLKSGKRGRGARGSGAGGRSIRSWRSGRSGRSGRAGRSGRSGRCCTRRCGGGRTGSVCSPSTAADAGCGTAVSPAVSTAADSGVISCAGEAGEFSAAGSPASALAAGGRGPGRRPRPPRRPRRRLSGRRAAPAAGKFKLDCSSGTDILGRMAARPLNAMVNCFYFFTNSANDAVKPCRKFFSPTGPISPLPKKPARPTGPKCACTSSASWLGRPNKFRPRPLQQQRQPP